jgi:PIN domain nuclease of toxin-antitoxin system
MQIKAQFGKLTLRLSLADILREEQQRNGLQIEAITLDDILALSKLPSLHRDPFDRMLIVQAQRRDFQIVSHDAELARYGVATLW